MKHGWPLFLAAGFGIVTALAASPSLAVLYKWIDENGRGAPGETPPAGVKADRINAATPPADPAAVKDLASKDAEIRKRSQQRVDEAAKAEKDQADLVRRRSQCQQARNNILALRAGNVYRYNEKGERVFSETAGRERAITENQVLIRDLGCTSVTGPG
jgi:hypothetical protein